MSETQEKAHQDSLNPTLDIANFRVPITMAKNKTKHYRDMLRRFDMEYGTTGTKLEGWQRLCQDCGVKVGNSITQCKKSIVAAHINIVDLIQAKSRGHYPIHHPNRIALANYTLDNDKVFPKRIAQENGFLKALLVQVF